jgi:hypothetical protein
MDPEWFSGGTGKGQGWSRNGLDVEQGWIKKNWRWSRDGAEKDQRLSSRYFPIKKRKSKY